MTVLVFQNTVMTQLEIWIKAALLGIPWFLFLEKGKVEILRDITVRRPGFESSFVIVTGLIAVS